MQKESARSSAKSFLITVPLKFSNTKENSNY
jgi:hypothetical protein